jgi:hypothetical protein
MNTTGLPFRSIDSSRACGVVAGLLEDEEGAYTSRMALRASEFMNALLPDYNPYVEPKESEKCVRAYIGDAYDGDTQRVFACFLLSPEPQ